MIALSVGCTYWDIYNGTRYCPVCGASLQLVSEDYWNRYTEIGDLEQWVQGRCFPTWKEAQAERELEAAADRALAVFPSVRLDRGLMIEWVRAIRARRTG